MAIHPELSLRQIPGSDGRIYVLTGKTVLNGLLAYELGDSTNLVVLMSFVMTEPETVESVIARSYPPGTFTATKARA